MGSVLALAILVIIVLCLIITKEKMNKLQRLQSSRTVPIVPDAIASSTTAHRSSNAYVMIDMNMQPADNYSPLLSNRITLNPTPNEYELETIQPYGTPTQAALNDENHYENPDNVVQGVIDESDKEAEECETKVSSHTDNSTLSANPVLDVCQEAVSSAIKGVSEPSLITVEVSNTNPIVCSTDVPERVIDSDQLLPAKEHIQVPPTHKQITLPPTNEYVKLPTTYEYIELLPTNEHIELLPTHEPITLPPTKEHVELQPTNEPEYANVSKRENPPYNEKEAEEATNMSVSLSYKE